MNKNINSEKGYVLALVLIFIVIILTASVGFYASVRHLLVETQVREVGLAQGYYTALAVLRYATILLEDPDTLFVAHGDTPPIQDGDHVTIEIPPDYQSFADDIGLVLPHKVTLTITARARDGDFDFETDASYEYEPEPE